jgi:hypothetical protein
MQAGSLAKTGKTLHFLTGAGADGTRGRIAMLIVK